ncbi:MAG TPA: hypothetical protein VKT53_14100 [Candidatus Acidoferrum sp.]|nr:hypothetical protein [Candidatus Acidoferrum sp.]
MQSGESGGTKLNGNRRALGACWFLYGIFRIVVGICLIVLSGTATVMFGALLSRVPDPYTLMAIFHVAYVGFVILAMLGGFFGILAGLALLGNQRSARTLALIAALLSVSEVPVGTTLGIYTLILVMASARLSSTIQA